MSISHRPVPTPETSQATTAPSDINNTYWHPL
jgi:hypothetical protein